MVKRYRSGWWLAVKYHEEEMTQREIADECGISPRAVRKYMKEFGIERREAKGENHGLHGQEREDSVKEKIAETLDGRHLSQEACKKMSESHTGNEIPDDVRSRISDSLAGLQRPKETRRKMSESRTGKDNPNWRGGGPYRYGPGWKSAREHVRKRDGVCQHCNHDGSERTLDVHHIIPVREFRETDGAALRDAHQHENLVLLCRSCHMDAEYGRIDFEAGIEHPKSDTETE